MFRRYDNYRWKNPIVFLLGGLLSLSPLAFAESGDNPGIAVDLKTAISRVAKENIPAVVRIEVTRRQEVPSPQLPFEDDPVFRYFFDFPNSTPKKFKAELKGLGNGMMMDSRGYILTNYHIIARATEIQVMLSDGIQCKATLVGADSKTDLAIIRIETKDSLPHVNFGDSDKIDIGDWVVALGFPRGLDQTVTQGIIRATHRQGITDPGGYQDFIQTDAAINPGNSGGPLLNLQGKVIGINAAIISESGGFEGIGFAIPSNMALHIAKELIAHGKVVRGWLGVSIQDLTPELTKSLGLTTTKGVLIADVLKGGPADMAGIQCGDVVTTYEGKKISDADSLRNEVASTSVGQTVTLTVQRKDEKYERSVKILKLQPAGKRFDSLLKDRMGVVVRTVTSKETQKYNLEVGQGVAIVWLEPSGSLKRAGFELGDIILEINAKPVDSLNSFVDLVNPLKSNERIILLALDHRTGQRGYVEVVVR